MHYSLWPNIVNLTYFFQLELEIEMIHKRIYTPGQNVWSGSKSVVTFGLIKILTHPC